MLDPHDIAEKLRTARKELGFTQSQLAERAGVSLPTIARMENGSVFSASFGTVMRALNAVGYDLSLERGVAPIGDDEAYDERRYLINRFYYGRRSEREDE